VNEILSASALTDTEANEAIHLEEVDVAASLCDSLSPFELIIERKKLRLTRDDFSFTLTTDRKRLSLILSNLISNAVNYTDDGGCIRVEFREGTLAIENDCNNLDGDLERLFEPFYTLSYSRDKVKSGTGLGLYIVKRNLELLNIPYDIARTESGLRFSIDFKRDKNFVFDEFTE